MEKEKKFHVELSTFFRDKTMVGVSIAPLSAKFNLSFVSFTLSLISETLNIKVFSFK